MRKGSKMKTLLVTILVFLVSVCGFAQISKSVTSVPFADSAAVSGNGFDTSKDYTLTGKITSKNYQFFSPVGFYIGTPTSSALGYIDSYGYANFPIATITYYLNLNNGTSYHHILASDTAEDFGGDAHEFYTPTTHLQKDTFTVRSDFREKGLYLMKPDTGIISLRDTVRAKIITGMTNIQSPKGTFFDSVTTTLDVANKGRFIDSTTTTLAIAKKERIYDSLTVPKINGNTVPTGNGTFALKSDIADSSFYFSQVTSTDLYVPANSEKDTSISYTSSSGKVWFNYYMDGDGSTPSGLLISLSYSTGIPGIFLRIRNFTGSPISCPPVIINILDKKN